MQGWEVIRAEHLNQLWKEKYDEWLKRPKSKSKKKEFDKRNRETNITDLLLSYFLPATA
jgi:hypothetical protein